MPVPERIENLLFARGGSAAEPIVLASQEDVVVDVAWGDDTIVVWYNDQQVADATLSNWRPLSVSLRHQSRSGPNHVRLGVWNIGGGGSNNAGIDFKISVTDLAGNKLPRDPLFNRREIGHETRDGWVRQFDYWFQFTGL